MSNQPKGNIMGQHSISNLFIFFLIGLFAVLAIMLTLISMRAYNSVSQASVNNSESQVALSYLLNKVRAGDQRGGVFLTDNVLCLREQLDGDVYETRIFFDNGALREYFCQADEPFDPEEGETLVQLQSLTMTAEKPGVIFVEAVQNSGVQQSLHIALHAEETTP